ncbi:hypothetical protein NA57DRAFT_42348 [Rhizodiscina lignyota]|uniref:Centrosomin N-terminal motif 1 domain-containing protein n=1 Tax=Rhizodiscina lignyota TaxID=1504668 RepID=A0A9P4IBI3_9PEZI|nr:hypothetical protein NA57DRAFT_42348 [Rhizodiscina lignyota]
MTTSDAHLHTESLPDPPSSEADLPPLPSEQDDNSQTEGKAGAEDSSVMRSDVDDSNANEDSAVVEHNMRRKLMDIESSFMPEQPSAAMIQGEQDVIKGADDTFLFGGSPGNGLRDAREDNDATEDANAADTTEELETMSPATPADAYKTPAPTREELEAETSQEDNDTSAVEAQPSSPSAAAAQRNRSRSRGASVTDQPLADESEAAQVPSERAQTPEQTYTHPATTSPTTTIRPQDAAAHSEHDHEPSEPSVTDDDPLMSPQSNFSSAHNRPSALHSRQLSQFSSVSSLSHRSDLSLDGTQGSDITVGADFALQSGGAAPATNGIFGRPISRRLLSASSISSSISDFHDSNFSGSERPRLSAHNSGLEPLDELGEPATPRADAAWTGLNTTANPTDTVIAQHVRNIRVPDTVAREYLRTHQQASANHSPDKRTSSVSFSARASAAGAKSNLTLKEQNSKIDKLSKENFDLKLKIHFLDQALQNRSDEGVKDMIGKNVQLQTDLANEKKENQTLRRKVRELERKIKGFEEQQGQGRPSPSESDEDKSAGSRYAELEEEIIYLRECLQHSETQVERLREDGMAREVERRKLAGHLKNVTDSQRRQSADHHEASAGVEEAMDMWKDLLQSETARREQADEDAQRLREEVRQLKGQLQQRPTSSGHMTTNHVRNTYHINKRQQYSYHNAQGDNTSRPTTATAVDSITAASSATIEQLKHENAELRRDLGAQTSMLTSRNRERERLQQEIEDLKIHARRAGTEGLGLGGRSVAGDSIFERSVSRAGQARQMADPHAGHGRSASRLSGTTGMTRGTEAIMEEDLSDFEREREEWERKVSEVRDELANSKMMNQDLESALNEHLDKLEATEGENKKLLEEREGLVEDLQGLQAERDEALLSLEDKEAELQGLHEEAIEKIEELEDAIAAKEEELARVGGELEAKSEDFTVLQGEMKAVSESLVKLEDDMAGKRRKIQSLENDVQESEREIDELEKRIQDLNSKNERLEVQLESTQGEVAFLREEQEGDKIKIGELEASLVGAQTAYQEEKERLEEERRQREIIDSQEKDEVKKLIDELNVQLGKARDEVRKLRKQLSTKEVEASTWKERLDTLESNLREALGDINGTRTSFLRDIQDLQHSLDKTVQELDLTRAHLAERDRLLRNRDALLESTGLESRKLSDLLDKERLARRQERQQFDHAQRSHQMNARTIQSHESKVLELETQRGVDRRKMAVLEDKMKDQLTDRNNLLLALWHRLSTLCGADWAQQNTLVDGQVPSLEVIAKNLSGFNRNIIHAVKTVEGIVGGFRSRIRNIEKDLWKDFQTLEHTLDVRVKRLEQLERIIDPGLSPNKERSSRTGRSASRTSSRSGHDGPDYARLKSENKLLKAELNFHRQTSPGPTTRASSIAESTGVEAMRSPSRGGTSHTMAPSLIRGYTTSAIEGIQGQNQQHNIGITQAPLQPSEARWIHRLKELERRLKAEREARLLDRSGARKRLEEGRVENEELRGRLEREKVLRQSSVD